MHGEDYSPLVVGIDLMNEVDNYWTVDEFVLQGWVAEMRSHLIAYETSIGLPAPHLVYASFVDGNVATAANVVHNNYPSQLVDLMSPHMYWDDAGAGLNYGTDILGSLIYLSDAIGTHLLYTDTGLTWCAGGNCGVHGINPHQEVVPLIVSEWGPIYAEELYQSPDTTYFRLVSLTHYVAGASGFGLRWPFTGGAGSDRYSIPDSFLSTLQGLAHVPTIVRTQSADRWGTNIRNLTMPAVGTAGGTLIWVKNSAGQVVQRSICQTGGDCGIGVVASSNARCQYWDDTAHACTSYAADGDEAGDGLRR